MPKQATPVLLILREYVNSKKKANQSEQMLVTNCFDRGKKLSDFFSEPT